MTRDQILDKIAHTARKLSEHDSRGSWKMGCFGYPRQGEERERYSKFGGMPPDYWRLIRLQEANLQALRSI